MITTERIQQLLDPYDSSQTECDGMVRICHTVLTNHGINADCNGAANIIHKVSTTLGLDLSGVSRGALAHPTRIYIWVTAKNRRSDVDLSRRVASF